MARFRNQPLRNIKVRTAFGLRKAGRFVESFATKHSKSKSVRELATRAKRIGYLASDSARPAKRMFQNEAFLSLAELKSDEINAAFRDIKKTLFWDKHDKKIFPLISAGGLFGGAASSIGLAVLTHDTSSVRPIATFVVIYGSSTAFVVSKMWKYRNGFSVKKNLETAKTFLNQTENSRVRQLMDSKQYNFLIADIKNGGFRLCKIQPNALRFVERIGDSKGGIIVLNKKGEIVYPKVEEFDNKKNPINVVPTLERRRGVANRRRQSRRSGDEKARGKDRRAPENERQVLQF